MAEKVLIIDDDVDTLRLVGLMLQRQGYLISAAANGEQGLAKAFEEKPNLILLDVMMPDMDGPSTLQLLRSNQATAEIPVIFLTAKVQGSDRKRFAEMGVAAVLAKPFDPMLLCGQIAEALGWNI